MRSRHRNLTVFISALHMFDLHPTCRRNVDHLLVFPGMSHSSLAAIREEWMPMFDRGQTTMFLQDIPDHEVLVIDLLKSYDESALNHGVSLRKYKAEAVPVPMIKSAYKGTT